MSATYLTSYQTRYQIPAVQEKTEVAVVTAAVDIQAEDPATADHANRLRWANWAIQNSPVAWLPFGWPVAMNPTIASSVATDPSGQSVADTDVQFVVNSNLERIITTWIANPPLGY